MNRQNKPIYEKTIQLLNPSSTDTILDMGCGNGYMLNMLAQRFEGNSVGLDLSESAIKSALKRNKSYVKNGKMRLLHHDLSIMPFEPNTFDKVYTVNTVYFWNDLKSVMTEVKRVLKPDGIFINTLFSNEMLDSLSFTKFGYKKFTEEQLTNAGVDVGFEVSVIPIFKGIGYCYIYKNEEE